jgi:hypothetical protein
VKVKKGIPKTAEAVLIGTRVPAKTKEQFEEVARQNNRSISGELRVLIERRIEEHRGETA